MKYVCEVTKIAAIGKRFAASSCPKGLTAATGCPVTVMGS